MLPKLPANNKYANVNIIELIIELVFNLFQYQIVMPTFFYSISPNYHEFAYTSTLHVIDFISITLVIKQHFTLINTLRILVTFLIANAAVTKSTEESFTGRFSASPLIHFISAINKVA